MGQQSGIDVSKDSLDVVLIDGSRQFHKVFSNHSIGHKHLHNWLIAQGVGQLHVCLEATGQYGEEVAAFLYQRGHSVSVVNPAQFNVMESERCTAQDG